MAEEKITKAAAEKKAAEAKDAKAKDTKAKAKKGKGKTKRRSLPEGHVHIMAGYNNTIVSISEPNGDIVAWASCGSCGFKGARKSTPYAAQVAAETATEKAKAFGLERVHVFLHGPGPGREQSMRGLINAGLSIESITDTTAVPHNGCRVARSRRV